MTVKKISLYSIVAAIYVALTLALASFSFGPIQIRVAEVLILFVLFRKDMILPLTFACLITNFVGVLMGTDIIGMMDVLFGTFASFLSLYFTYFFRNVLLFNRPILSLMMPVIFNALIVGAMLSYVIMPDNFMMGLLINGLQVGIGEFIAVVVLGLIVYKPFMNFVQNLKV